MTHCPTDSLLRAFVSKRLDPVEAEPLEIHLEQCSACCVRLEQLQDVPGLSAILSKAVAKVALQSPSLVQVMEHLQRELVSQLDTPSAFRTGNSITLDLPVLKPSEHAGSIGRIGNIEIRRVIVRGGMGVVYEGLDPALQRTVAVKVLSPHLLSDREAKERFLREAQAIATLDAEHVVRIYAIEQVDEVPYLVLQYVDGSSLADILQDRQRLPIEEVVRIGIQLAKGLASAHAHGLVHRDIKPANVLIELTTQHVRLTDFGLAKLIGGKTITNFGSLAGTPALMSPEQAIGEDVDARSDLFSLGVLLYTAVTGRLPFAGDSSFVVLNNIRTQSPKRLSDFDSAIPIWFSMVVHRLLEKKPELRYQSAAEVVEALQQQRSRQAVRKPQRILWILLASALVLGLTTWFEVQSVLNSQSDQAPMQTTLKSNELRIVGREERLYSLEEAVANAVTGDTIEFLGDGPHYSGKLVVTDKRLTFRAAAGCVPVIQPQESTPTSGGQWLTSTEDLTLEGITIDWSTARRDEQENTRDVAVIALGKSAALTMKNCRVFVAGPRSVCVSTDGPMLMEACHLVCPQNSGRCVEWRSSQTLTLTGTCLEGRNGLVFDLGEAKSERLN